MELISSNANGNGTFSKSRMDVEMEMDEDGELRPKQRSTNQDSVMADDSDLQVIPSASAGNNNISSSAAQSTSLMTGANQGG